MSSDTPWYAEGLRFRCTQCGNCCTGAPGYVWVTNEEIAVLAEATGASSVEEFEQQFVRNVGVRKSLREFSNGDCVFFDSQQRKCNVYAARPRQCRTWPFWDSNLRSPEAWKETCQVCPGSGKGDLYSCVQIEAQRRVIHV
jgi:Fe-S-cluster containining protein